MELSKRAAAAPCHWVCWFTFPNDWLAAAARANRAESPIVTEHLGI